MNIDLLDQAKSFVERKKKREEFMQSLDSEHQRIVEEIIENLKRHKKNLGGDEIIMSENEKDVKGLAEKYGIKINRMLMSKERHKGYNKCKDNDLAFIFHKKGSLFPRRGYVEPYQIAIQRQELLDDLEKRIRQIDESKMYRKEIYDYAYRVHVSPRMSSLSPNSSFMSLKNKYGSTMEVQGEISQPAQQISMKQHAAFNQNHRSTNINVTDADSSTLPTFKLKLINQTSETIDQRNAKAKMVSNTVQQNSPRDDISFQKKLIALQREDQRSQKTGQLTMATMDRSDANMSDDHYQSLRAGNNTVMKAAAIEMFDGKFKLP